MSSKSFGIVIINDLGAHRRPFFHSRNVVSRDLGEQILQPMAGDRRNRAHAKFTPLDPHFHFTAWSKPQLLENRPGQAHRRTVSPLGDLSFQGYSPGYTMYVRS